MFDAINVIFTADAKTISMFQKLMQPFMYSPTYHISKIGWSTYTSKWNITTNKWRSENMYYSQQQKITEAEFQFWNFSTCA